MNPNKDEEIVVKKDKLLISFIDLINNNSEFEDAISSATGNKARVNTRFS